MSCVVDFTEHLMMLRNHLLMNVAHTSKKAVFAVAELRRQFEFSAERLSENAKSIKITLFAELLTVISPIYAQSLQ